MIDFITIGSTPPEEDCLGVGHPLSRAETCIYRRQLRREFPLVNFLVKGFPHDFGTYYEVVATYHDEESAALAFQAEESAPRWDAEAVKELRAAGIRK